MTVSLVFDAPTLGLFIVCFAVIAVGKTINRLSKSGKWETIEAQLVAWNVRWIWRLKGSKTKRRRKQQL